MIDGLEKALIETVTRADSRPFPESEAPALASNTEAVSFRFTGASLESSLDQQPLVESATWDIDVFSADRATLFTRLAVIADALVRDGFGVDLGEEAQILDSSVHFVTLAVGVESGG